MENINRDDYKRFKESDERSTQELIQAALQERKLSDDDWPALMELRYRGGLEDFEAAKSLCKSNSPIERALGADILGSSSRKQEYIEESVQILLNMLKNEQDVEVLNSIGVSFGHIKDERGIEPLSKLKNHSHEDVRHGVVLGLLTHENTLAIQTLIELSQDINDEVRDWATFGLGAQIESDTPEIREALMKNIDNPHEETRYEAIEGLVLRKDKRIVDRLIEEIVSGQIDFGSTLMLDICEMLSELKDEITDSRHSRKMRGRLTGVRIDKNMNDAISCRHSPDYPLNHFFG